jgi:rod shape-determining protein MreD
MVAGRKSVFVTAAALIGALALNVVPLPAAVSAFKPDWVAAVLLYWSIASPQRAGLFTAFFMGLALDVLSGALLGQHALALVVILYLSQRFHLRIRVFPTSQVAATLFVLLGIYEFTLFWVDGVAGREVPAIERFGPLLSTAILVGIALLIRDQGVRTTSSRIEA